MKSHHGIAVLGFLASLPLAVLGSPFEFGTARKAVMKRTQQLALDTNFPDPSLEQVSPPPKPFTLMCIC